MAKKMLIDATHPEETRVVVVDGNKVEEFDFETINKRQLAGNIYLAKVTRVEPSLQAAFVDYGGNRHGFLAFAEIHPDYYQIPVADRQALLAEERALAREEEEEENRRSRRRKPAPRAERAPADPSVSAPVAGEAAAHSEMDVIDLSADEGEEAVAVVAAELPEEAVAEAVDTVGAVAEVADSAAEAAAPAEEAAEAAPEAEAEENAEADEAGDHEDHAGHDHHGSASADEIETIAEEDVSEEIAAPRRQRLRKYKIQEVIKVRQIMLVQVVKEERGNKGAALTTYLSLAGRYCVLMPNTARGGGISRKITQAADRKKLKEIAGELEVPEGAGLIIRTAGAKRTKPEIRRDYEYLMRLWEQIRDLTLRSVAPAAIYEEGDLIKRTIRDLYSREIDEVLVEGEAGYRSAKDFMRMIMPAHAKQVKRYDEPMPLFARYQVESYLGGMFNPVVQLKSGGYIVIGITEALVAIDVNSGRATKEGSIEDTALKTNLEACDEVARQLRLRDLAGLIVIDFIDMEERRNNASVEKRLKDRLKTDRARIQVGRISGFGLMEMSRQRLRPGMLESTTQPCPHCHGTGLIRSDDSMALTILRALEEEGTRKRSKEVLLKAPISIVNYLFNHKREHIALIEARYGMAVRMEADPHMVSPDYELEKFKTATRALPEPSQVISGHAGLMGDLVEEEDEDLIDEALEEEEAADEEAAVTTTAEGKDDAAGEGGNKKKRRRRRRRRGGRDGQDGAAEGAEAGSDEADEDDAGDAGEQSAEGQDVSDAAAATQQEVAEAAPVAKSRSRSRSRSKSATAKAAAEVVAAEVAAAEAGAADQAVPAEAAAGAADEAAVPEADPAAATPAAKPRRSRAKSARAASAEAVTEAADASPADEAATAEAVADTAADTAEAAPKKASRSRASGAKAAAKPAAEKATGRGSRAKKAEVVPADDAPAAEPVETVAAAPVAEAPKVEAPVAEAPVAEALTGQAPAVAAETVASEPTEDPADDDRPRRKGWWSQNR
ncbi:ribonuclease E/G [Xinfangfangia sp. D13-10-4-6]|uniref:Rne/Rng family ribonuclease n=1 Tax=Pseudogemmobacter hezensis TaxID=2737662 RepID=UPI001557C5C3|nr:ribonuclease E/G [Pseudogemmobacter hezensis]NPD13815.1 ribonuclease E/G [Pseudogemmobacter hezensis]